MGRQMRQYFGPAAIVFVGLLGAQMLFTLYVYQSNNDLLKSLETIENTGYLTVPNVRIKDSLDAFMPAFCGGFFFTLTAGAGLILTAFFLIYLWRSVFACRPNMFFVILFLWALGIYKAAQTGAPRLLTAFFFLIPLMVFVLMMKWLKGPWAKSGWRVAAVHLPAVITIAVIWLPNMNSGVFVNIRDQILLSNPAGRAINSFYYRYTLYPAESFKPLHRKQLKTAKIQIEAHSLFNRIEKSLRRLDYLPVSSGISPDLTVRSRGDRLLLAHQGQTVLEVQTSRFLRSPKETLQDFSQQMDQMTFLRQFTFFSLIFASPILLYFFIHTFVSCVLVGIRQPIKRSVIAAAVCVMIAAAGAYALFPFQGTINPAGQAKNLIGEWLRSDSSQLRVCALKRIDKGDLPIAAHESALMELGKSPAIAERYWTARVLGNSDSERTYRQLLQLLHDPHSNVVCMALYSLGNRQADQAIKEIKRILIASDHWYVQWYAYNALKELGWVQPKSVSYLC